MSKKEECEDYEIKFWKDWLNADSLTRLKIVEKLPIVKSVWDTEKLPAKIRKHSFYLMLNSFFEDLESAVYTKIRLDEKPKSLKR